MIDTQSDGTWTTQKAPIPVGLAGFVYMSLYAIACPSAGSCVAVGDDADMNSLYPLVETLSDGTWTATEPVLPANAGSQPRVNPGYEASVELNQVTCPDVDDCVASGTYMDSSGNPQFLIETLSGGTWSPAEAPAPPDEAPPLFFDTLSPLSCTTVGSCTGVASYTDTSHVGHGLIETLSGGTWTVSVAPLPSSASADDGAHLTGVTCPASGSCVAVGGYSEANFPSPPPRQGLIETLSGGVWTATEAPSAPGDSNVELAEVSCPAVGDCVAAGDDTDTDDVQHPFSEILSGGVWAPTDVAVPRRSVAGLSDLGSIACPGVGSCVAAGAYEERQHHQQGLLATLSNGTWTTTNTPLPAGQTNGRLASLFGPTCWEVGSCALVGSFLPQSGGAAKALIETPSGLSSPAISSADHAAFTVGTAGTFSVTSTGSPAPAITEGGKLPSGLKFIKGRGTATIAGTPKSSDRTGTYDITIKATNGVAPNASQSFTLTLSP
jgi:hypothetical protein